MSLLFLFFPFVQSFEFKLLSLSLLLLLLWTGQDKVWKSAFLWERRREMNILFCNHFRYDR